jgi:hypothetical protein
LLIALWLFGRQKSSLSGAIEYSELILNQFLTVMYSFEGEIGEILIDVTAKADFMDAIFLNHDCAVILQEIICVIQ